MNKYKIEIYQEFVIVDEFQSGHIEDIYGWFKQNWRKAYWRNECSFIVYRDGTRIGFKEMYEWGFYD